MIQIKRTYDPPPRGDGRRILVEHALSMVARMDEEGFGNCTWHGECQATRPKSIGIDTLAGLNREWLGASLVKSSIG